VNTKIFWDMKKVDIVDPEDGGSNLCYKCWQPFTSCCSTIS